MCAVFVFCFLFNAAVDLASVCFPACFPVHAGIPPSPLQPRLRGSRYRVQKGLTGSGSMFAYFKVAFLLIITSVFFNIETLEVSWMID